MWLKRGLTKLGLSSWSEPAMCCLLGLSSRDHRCAAFLMSVPNLSCPLSLAGQPRIRHHAARQDHWCLPSFFPNAPPCPYSVVGETRVEWSTRAALLPPAHLWGKGLSGGPFPPKDLPASRHVSARAACRQEWQARLVHRAVGCAGSCFHRHVFSFKILFYPELSLWTMGPSATEFQMALETAITNFPGRSLGPMGNTVHCSVFRGEAQAGKRHGRHHPAWVGTAPRAPSSPFSALAAPPTTNRHCCDPPRAQTFQQQLLL